MWDTKGTGLFDSIKNKLSDISSRVSTEQLNELSLQIDDIQGAISSQNVDGQKISALNDAITNLEAKVQEIEDAFNNNGGPAAPAPGETKSGLSLYDLKFIIGLSGLLFMSITGAKTTWIPIASASWAVICPCL